MRYGALKIGLNTQNQIKFKKILVHSPVLLQNVIKSLDVNKKGLYIDATVGEGGHLREILVRGGKTLALDIDSEQIAKVKNLFNSYIKKGQLVLSRNNFADLEKAARQYNFFPVDGILIDLGLSYRQIVESGRGFSYEKPNEILDMRLDKSIKVKARDIVKSYTEDELYELFAGNSEDINSRSIAENIVRSRSIRAINTVRDLLNVINKTLNKKDMGTYARIFQALRMGVNNEIENLKSGIIAGSKILRKGGKLLIITFHSIEDRIVKNFVNNTKLFAQMELIKGNREFRYERSAKLRVLIKK